MFVTRISSPQELQEVMLRTSAQQPNQEVIMNTVTEAQVNYINRLQAERRWEDIPALEQQVADARFAWRKGQFSKRDASLLIHNLDLAHRRETAVVEQEAASIEGMHRLDRSEEHTSELQSLMRISYAVFCLKKKKTDKRQQ